MWSWAASVAKAAGSSVAQFSQECIESVTSVDEAPTKNSKLLFDVDVATEEDEKPPAPVAASAPAPATDDSTAPAAASSGWLPRELDFAAGQTRSLFELSKALVDRGAEVALQLLPDIDTPSPTAAAAPPPSDAAGGATREVEPARDPLDSMRLARGAVCLRYAEPRHEALRALALDLLNPIAVSEFDMDEAPASAADVQHLQDTAVGRRLQTARREMSLVLSDTTGEVAANDELLAALSTLPARASEGAGTLVDMLLDEVATAFLPAAASSSTDGASSAVAEWYVVDVDAAQPSPEDIIRQRCARVGDLVKFGQCEVAFGAAALSAIAVEAFQFAKRTSHADIKAIKEQSLTVRGDCYSGAAENFCRLEEACECIAALLTVDLCRDSTTPTAVVRPSEAETEAPIAPSTDVVEAPAAATEAPIVAVDTSNATEAFEAAPVQPQQADAVETADGAVASSELPAAATGEPEAAPTGETSDVTSAELQVQAAATGGGRANGSSNNNKGRRRGKK